MESSYVEVDGAFEANAEDEVLRRSSNLLLSTVERLSTSRKMSDQAWGDCNEL